jgi:type IV pilus assembly protein PilN
MIRTNLSTRPFYNERVISLWLLLFLVVVLAATIFNAERVLRYSRNETEQGTSASRDEEQASKLRASAAKLRNSVDAKQVERASNEARQANDLIDRRTFSWTELFNVFEHTLPDDVRITAVRPNVDRGSFQLRITVVARGVDDVNAFLNNLQMSGTFRQVASKISERVAENGELQAELEMEYMPPSGHAAGRAARTGGASR